MSSTILCSPASEGEVEEVGVRDGGGGDDSGDVEEEGEGVAPAVSVASARTRIDAIGLLPLLRA